MKKSVLSFMRPLYMAIGIFLLMPYATHADNLSPLDDAALSDVSGQAGIAVDLALNMNTDANGNPLSTLSNCTGVGNPCRMAWNFYSRGSGNGQEWIVWKDFFGLLKINGLWIDADQSSNSNSPYPDNRSVNRFMNGAGNTCLPDGSNKTSTCYQATTNMPMLALQFKGAANDNVNGLQLYLHVGGVVVEYGATGYNSDSCFNYTACSGGVASGSIKPAVALMIADKSGVDAATPTASPANIKITGKIGLYGF